MVQPNLFINHLVPHPIGKLPIETLEMILIECARDDYSPSNVFTPTERDAFPDWLYITYVCRLWRGISLGCPHLWTRITTNLTHRWVTEFLERSRNYPLVLEISTVHSHFSEIKAVISANAFRIKELYVGDIRARNRDLRRELDGRLTAHMPLLENFILDTDLYEIQDDLFSGHAPRLRRLWLGDAMTSSITSSLLGNLRELVLGESYDTDYLLKLLQHTPLLETLKVKDLVPDLRYSGDVVRLPHLSRLCIQLNEYRHFVDFLAPLQMPPTVHFRLTLCVSRESSSEEEYGAALDVMADRIRGISKSLGPLYANVYIEPEKNWCIGWYPMLQTLGDPTVDRIPRRALLDHGGGWSCRCEHQCDPPFLLALKTTDVPYAATMVDVRCMVDRIAPVANVHALRLNLTLPDGFAAVQHLSEEGPMRYPPFETWAPALSLMSDVRILILASDAVAGILMALTLDGNVGGSPRTPLLPKLSTLVIVKSDPPDARLYDYPPGLNIIGVLEVFLSQRLEFGLKLERLVIDSDNDDQELMEYLRKYVKDMSYEVYTQGESV